MTTFTYSTFLTVTNFVLEELNEVPLTSSNFGSAVGFQQVAKNAVIKAVKVIQNQQWEWPFNHVYATQVLTPGVPFYALPDDCKSVDWDTFFLERNDALPNPQRAVYLPEISYDSYVTRCKAQDVQADSTQWSSPWRIFRTQNTEFGVTPYPDQAYTVDYEYWRITPSISLYNDPLSTPHQFDYVVTDGAMGYCYRFRENLDAAAEAFDRFNTGIKDMRDIYITNYLKLTDTRVGPQFGPR